MKHIKHVVCGMSGGVDSAVSAMILKQKGFHVEGVFMKNWDLTNETGHCTAEADREDAEFVCNHLKIPFREVTFVKEYWTEVFSEMVKGYEEGLTPNPDILCNKNIKFGHFFKQMVNEFGADGVATGHYARNSYGQFLEKSSQTKGARLLKAIDQLKDQTLFLSQIPQIALQKTMFPVGDLTKDVVKKMALRSGLESIVRKKESTGICFIGKREFQNFIEEYCEPNPGDFVDLETGEVVGHHKGIHYWTIGQRTHLRGFNVAYFVQDINRDTNSIFVVKGTDHPALFTHNITATHPHWIHSPPRELSEDGVLRCHFKYQHIHPVIGCVLRRISDGHLSVEIDRPMRAIAPGQYAVFYREEECLGSATIIGTGPSLFQQNVHERVKNYEGFL